MPHCTVEKITYFQLKRSPSIKESQRFWSVFKQEEASVLPNAFQWWVRWWNEEGSVTYKKSTCPTFASSHAWECCQSVGNLLAAVKGGRNKTHSNFMNAWQVSTSYLARCPEWLTLQTTSSTRNQKFRQAPVNLPSVSEAMVSNWDMPDIMNSNRAHFYFQILLLWRTFDIRHQKHHKCPHTTPTILYDVLCCQRDYCTLYLGRPSKMEIGTSPHYIHTNTILLIPRAYCLPKDKIYGPCKMVLQPSTDCFFSRWFIIIVMSPSFPVCLIWLLQKFYLRITKRQSSWSKDLQKLEARIRDEVTHVSKETLGKWHGAYPLMCNSAFNRKVVTKAHTLNRLYTTKWKWLYRHTMF